MHGFDDYLTKEQAAEVLNVKTSLLDVWRWNGKGPTYIRFGKVVRYSRAALQQFITANVYTSIQSQISTGSLTARPAFRRVGSSKETSDERKARLKAQRGLVARPADAIRPKDDFRSKRKNGKPAVTHALVTDVQD